jgi:hypothetical protein
VGAAGKGEILWRGIRGCTEGAVRQGVVRKGYSSQVGSELPVTREAQAETG